VARQEDFAQICRSVCEERGWKLIAGGIEVPLREGRHQLVGLEFFEFRSEELVRLHSTIGNALALPTDRLTTALRINAELAHGALAVREDDLVMVDTLSLSDSDPAEIEASIAYLAESADYYEKNLFHTDDH